MASSSSVSICGAPALLVKIKEDSFFPCTRTSLQAAPSQPTARGFSPFPAWKASWSSSSSRFTRAESMEESSSSGAVVVGTEDAEKSTGGGCPGCGRIEIIGGCNGGGRIQGGIGAVPGFGWWPIKAFRPCPAFIESGGRYRRLGQSLEEVAFGRRGAGDDKDIADRLKGRS